METNIFNPDITKTTTVTEQGSTVNTTTVKYHLNLNGTELIVGIIAVVLIVKAIKAIKNHKIIK